MDTVRKLLDAGVTHGIVVEGKDSPYKEEVFRIIAGFAWSTYTEPIAVTALKPREAVRRYPAAGFVLARGKLCRLEQPEGCPE